MSYRQALLDQIEALEPHEVSDLREWLEVLHADCEAFGPTPDDVARIARIEAKIAAHSPRG